MIKFFKDPKFKLLLALIILIAGFSVISFSWLRNHNTNQDSEHEPSVKTVQTMIINTDNELQNIRAMGQVIPEAQVDIISQAQGSLQSLDFEQGSLINKGQIIAQLYNESIFTSLSNAQINFNNMQASFNSSQRLADQAVYQAEIALQTAQESVLSAQISLQAAQTSAEIELENLYDNIPNILNNSYVSAFYAINTLIDPMFDYDDKLTFLCYNFQAKIDTEWQKMLSNNALEKLKTAQDLALAKEQLSIIQDFLYRLNDTLKSAILDPSVLSTYQGYNNTALTNVNASISTVNSQEQAIKSRKINNKNNIAMAQSQVDLTKLSEQNALAGLESAKQNKEQQLISVQSALDNAQGQLNLARAQINNLTIKSPISGQITAKYIELGQEVNPGQKIAQISNLDSLKIKASVPAEFASDLYLGQKTNLGFIVSINPAVDPITKKIDIEILSNNLNLIPGTFIDVEIPTKNNNKIFIPLSAVNIDQDQSFVFVVENSKAIKKPIIIGQSKNNLIEIISGLEINDQIILDKDVVDGEIVEVGN